MKSFNYNLELTTSIIPLVLLLAFGVFVIVGVVSKSETAWNQNTIEVEQEWNTQGQTADPLKWNK